MSFLHTLESIGGFIRKGTGIVAPFAPIVEAIPTIGPIFGTVFAAIVAVESIVPNGATLPGSAKKAAVTTLVQAAHPSVDSQGLSTGIDAIVSALNALHQAGVSLSASKQPK